METSSNRSDQKVATAVLRLMLLSTLLIAARQTASAQRPALPDLVVSNATIEKTADGLFIKSIAVTVNDACLAPAAKSYVLVTFKISSAADAKPIFYIGNTVKALKGGESYTQTFDVEYKKIGYGRFVYVEADPYKKVAEANENNNWMTLNPQSSPKSFGPGQCKVQ